MKRHIPSILMTLVAIALLALVVCRSIIAMIQEL